jgi:HK97 family phage portal protein
MRISDLWRGWGRGEAKAAGLTIEQLVARIDATNATAAGVNITPENCMQSPTVCAIVTAITRRISSLPVEVVEVTTSNGRTRTEVLPNHPVAKLLQAPNDWQDPVAFIADAVSALVRHGNWFAWKSRGSTGPIRRLYPLDPRSVQITQELDWSVLYRTTLKDGRYEELSPDGIVHARGPARDLLKGDSIVTDIREAIALEIQAERMGAAVFGNSALPSMVFKFEEGFQGFKTDEERAAFIDGFNQVYSKQGRFKAMLLPKGVGVDSSAPAENEKAQYQETRQYQRTVIAGAWGVPPHMVGDLAKGTFNNVEQQSLDFVNNVVLPYVRMLEAAFNKSLFTDEDKRAGRIVRFNLAGALRGDFKSRQEGLNIQRQAGVISPNDWRAVEGMNPLKPADGGDLYWQKGPSGQGGEDDPGSKPTGEDGKKPGEEAPANDDESEGTENAA